MELIYRAFEVELNVFWKFQERSMDLLQLLRIQVYQNRVLLKLDSRILQPRTKVNS